MEGKEDKMLLGLLSNLREFFKNFTVGEPMEAVHKISDRIK